MIRFWRAVEEPERPVLYLSFLSDADIVSLLRIPFAAITAYCLFQYGSLAGFLALFFFGLYVLSDFLDGIIARILGSSPYGRQVDSNSDKTGTALLFYAFSIFLSWFLPYGIIMLVREGLILLLRFWLEYLKIPFPADAYGKSKAIVQYIMKGIIILFILSARITHIHFFEEVALVATIAATVTTVWSGIHYVAKAWKLLHAKTGA